MASVQVEPALLSGAHDQPAVLAPALNVVFAGTVSVSTTPVAPRLPPFAYVKAYETVPPGATLARPSLFVIEKSGAPVSGVVSLPLLLPGVGSVPLAPSSAIDAVLLMCVTPAATGLTTVAANVAVGLPPPAASPPMASVQVEPALLSGAHDHPAVLAPALNVVFAGTVSVSATPVAPRSPPFAYVKVYATVPPGATLAPPSLLVIEKSGAPVSGVVSLPLLLAGVGSLPFVPSSAIDAVLLICVTPAAAGVINVAAKVAV